MYRRRGLEPEFFLIHPGGPFWAKKDDGAWSIPKGLYEPDEDPIAAAKREFEEETGCLPQGVLTELGTFRQPSGKEIVAFAAEGEFDTADFRSNTFSMEWPPKSGRTQEFPEADRAEWFSARRGISKDIEGATSHSHCASGRLGLGKVQRQGNLPNSSPPHRCGSRVSEYGAKGSPTKGRYLSFLLDTNVVSEWVKPRPDPRLTSWLAAVDEDCVFLCVVVPESEQVRWGGRLHCHLH